MLYDPTAPQINAETFKKQDWTYSTMMEEDCTEVLPPDMPTPHGKSFVIRCFVDADHAGDAVARKSRTGLLSTWIMLLSIGIPRDRGALRARHTRLSSPRWRRLQNRFVLWGIGLGWWGFQWKGLRTFLESIRVFLLTQWTLVLSWRRSVLRWPIIWFVRALHEENGWRRTSIRTATLLISLLNQWLRVRRGMGLSWRSYNIFFGRRRSD